MIDIAQALQGMLRMLPNAKYTTAALIDAAAVQIDTSVFVRERVLIIIANENTTAATTLAIEESNTSGGAFAAVPADALTNPATGAPVTIRNLSADRKSTRLNSS